MDFSDVVDNDVREVIFYCNKMIKMNRKNYSCKCGKYVNFIEKLTNNADF